MRTRCALAFALTVAGCNGSPANPAGPLLVRMQTVAVRIEGKVIDADSGEGISGAEVRLDFGWMMSGDLFHPADTISPLKVTDQNGSFALEWMLPVTWTELVIGVERGTFLRTSRHFHFSQSTMNAVVRMYPERTIRPGESLETEAFPGSLRASRSAQ